MVGRTTSWLGGRKFLVSFLVCLMSSVADIPGSARKPIPLLVPSKDHSKLELSQEGLDFIRRLDGGIAPVIVIGPYRSGKSFLLNSMIGVRCDEVGCVVVARGQTTAMPRGQQIAVGLPCVTSCGRVCRFARLPLVLRTSVQSWAVQIINVYVCGCLRVRVRDSYVGCMMPVSTAAGLWRWPSE